MNEQMAFSYSGCPDCVALARRILKRRRSMDWAELERILFKYQRAHPQRVHQMNLYPSVKDTPADEYKFMGMMFLRIPDAYYPVINTVKTQISLYSPLSFRWLKGYVMEHYLEHELRLELFTANGMISGHLETTEVDLNRLSKILARYQTC